MLKLVTRGKLIVLQGLDRSGKSSVTRSIREQLVASGLQAVDMNFPDRASPIGLIINSYLSSKTEINNETIHLLFSANRWENMPKIERLLAEGVSIICDRYWYSGVAYSCAKGMDYEWCVAPDRGLIQPDLIIYLRADPDVLKSRSNYGEEKYERVEFQRKVGQAFERLFKDNSEKVRVVEVGDKKLEDVIGQAKSLVGALLESTTQ